MLDSYLIHLDHPQWKQVGRCVYCGCGDRLYNGKLPKTEAERREFCTSMDAVVAAAIKQLEENQNVG